MNNVINIDLNELQPILNQLIASNLVTPYMKLLEGGRPNEEARNMIIVLWAELLVEIESKTEEIIRQNKLRGKT
jgi:hypothetical protein